LNALGQVTVDLLEFGDGCAFHVFVVAEALRARAGIMILLELLAGCGDWI